MLAVKGISEILETYEKRPLGDFNTRRNHWRQVKLKKAVSNLPDEFKVNGWEKRYQRDKKHGRTRRCITY